MILVETGFMSLFEEFLDERESGKPYQRCSMSRLRDHLSEADRQDLDAALADDRFTGAAIARRLNKVLGDNAYGIKGNTVQRHRNGVCSCPR